MDCDYLLVYGEGRSKDQKHVRFHAATPEEALENAKTVVKYRRSQAGDSQKFRAKLYREVKEFGPE